MMPFEGTPNEEKAVEMWEGVLEDLQIGPLWSLPIKIGVFQDSWLAEFGEEVPDNMNIHLRTILRKRLLVSTSPEDNLL